MYANTRRSIVGAAVIAVAAAMAGCGDYVRQGRSPSQLTIVTLEAASGAVPQTFSGTLDSDVITNVDRTVGGATVQVPTVFNDFGRVTMRVYLKDQGVPGIGAAPSAMNQVTINRYRVEYQRTDGRNQLGVEVPFPFDSATTFTVPADSTATQTFELVRHTAKEEAPLRALQTSGVIISTIAKVTFYGRDLAGNEVSVVGNIGILFGNFGDPE